VTSLSTEATYPLDSQPQIPSTRSTTFQSHFTLSLSLHSRPLPKELSHPASSMPPLRPLVRQFPRPSLTATTPSILSIRAFPAQQSQSSNTVPSISSSPLTCRLSSPASFVAQFSTSSVLRSDDAHGSHYDPPSGWLFGVPPDEKYKKEGWENIWVYGFWGSLGLAVVAYAYKPDSS